MKTDPGLEPTREARTSISREHANDPRRLVEYYLEYQRRFADRLRWARGQTESRRRPPSMPIQRTTLRVAADRQGVLRTDEGSRMTSTRAAGDSGEQRRAETEMLAVFGAQLGVTLAGKTYPLPGGATLQIDGVSERPPILCEACAHQGPPKAGQKRKIIADAFKLVYADQLLGRTFRKFILLADQDAAAPFKGQTWVAAAFEQLGVEVAVVELLAETRTGLRAAQVRQRR